MYGIRPLGIYLIATFLTEVKMRNEFFNRDVSFKVIVVFAVIMLLYQIFLSKLVINIISNKYLYELVHFTIHLTVIITVYKIPDIIRKHKQ